MTGKIFTTLEFSDSIIRDEKKKVLVGGCFDVLHYGHIQFLKKSKEQGDVLMIFLESDEHIIKRKNREQIHSQKQRAEILSYLEFTDFIILLPYISQDEIYFNLVKQINPNVIAITENDPKKDKKSKQARKIGAELVSVCPFYSPFSSTNIIERI